MTRRLRAVGVRKRFDEIPPKVRGWAEVALGSPIVSAQDQIGGMSPGCAVRIQTARGGRAFLKAVGSELNPDTPTLFRHEIEVLSKLPPVRYRASLLGSYDDGGWVALLLADVDGRHPDLAATGDRSAVRAVIERQVVELTPARARISIPTVSHYAERWSRRWTEIATEPRTYLPGWPATRFATSTSATTTC
ncbi:MAG: hypothetical protein ACYDAQ_02975 [Mycobacteriales bacterium]